MPWPAQGYPPLSQQRRLSRLYKVLLVASETLLFSDGSKSRLQYIPEKEQPPNDVGQDLKRTFMNPQISVAPHRVLARSSHYSGLLKSP